MACVQVETFIRTNITPDSPPNPPVVPILGPEKIVKLDDSLSEACSNSSDSEPPGDTEGPFTLTIGWPSVDLRRPLQIIPLKKQPPKKQNKPIVFQPFSSFMATEMTVKTLRCLIGTDMAPPRRPSIPDPIMKSTVDTNK